MTDQSKPQKMPCVALQVAPRHRFALGADERTSLRRLGDALEGREGDVAEKWASLYADAFADRSYYSAEESRVEAEREIAEVLRRIRGVDLRGLGDWLSARGKRLFERGVPFEEVCRSHQILESSVVATLRESTLDPAEVLDLVLALNRLNHERLVFLVEAYHGRCKYRWERRERVVFEGVAARESEEGGRNRLCGLVGRSEAMQQVYELLALASSSRDAVLICGPTGTGKELAARTIHTLSGDPPERFVPVNCAAISHELIESELFGHRRGSFTGAQDDHEGLFRAAHGGTLFLDEVTELPSNAQAKLLRALQERAIRPVGGLREVPVAVRIVASTNVDMAAALSEGRLRRDFYYRLHQMVIPLPPLVERRRDIPLLIGHFAEKAAEDGLCPRAPGFSRAAVSRLAAHSWPGNVRELENAVRLACRTSGSGLVEEHDLRVEGLDADEAAPVFAAKLDAPEDEPISIRDAERGAIARALSATEGNKTKAARLLGISRKQLYVKIRAYGL